MRKNIFVKSTLRQRVRSLVLLLLIAAAAFAFVTRATEYLVVTDKIEGIGKYYRSVGYLQNSENPGRYADVFAGAEVISQSLYTGLEDRRLTVEGELQGIINADFSGKTPDLRYNDAVFYGEVLNIYYAPFYVPPPRTAYYNHDIGRFCRSGISREH